MLDHIDLFSGIGGFALASRWNGIQTVQFVEIDPFCQRVLQKNFPGVPIHDDIKTFHWTGTNPFILTGGFPCQPFSTAKHGKKSRVDDFSASANRLTNEASPRYAIFENVQRAVMENLAAQLRHSGFGAMVRGYCAEEFGAWHKRNRWFVIAYPHDKGEFQGKFDAKMAIVQGVENHIWRRPHYPGAIRDANGIPNRMDRLRSLGNAIVPQVAAEIMRAIVRVEIGRA